MRLSKYLAQAGVASRRHAETLIQNGKVKVNGTVITELGTSIDPDCDLVEYNTITIRSEKQVYLLLNKPAGVISSASDPQGRKTVIDLLKNVEERVYPVGRLDYDTEGLLLLSNDGNFTNHMIHPRYKMEKTYEALVRGKVTEKALTLLRQGVSLEDGQTAPAKVRVLDWTSDKTVLEIVIHEGKKRQVKRMCDAVGYRVISLKRTAFAFLTLEGVKTGAYRTLEKHEIDRLYCLSGKEC
ncbi:MAG: pseudouridine synthase [Bacillota bacterium]|nr:pseudouridine synthase [Bacillota bacterium]